MQAKIETGPTAINPPGYVCLKAAVFRIFPDDSRRAKAMAVLFWWQACGSLARCYVGDRCAYRT